jgi:hypothetical protein
MGGNRAIQSDRGTSGATRVPSAATKGRPHGTFGGQYTRGSGGSGSGGTRADPGGAAGATTVGSVVAADDVRAEGSDVAEAAASSGAAALVVAGAGASDAFLGSGGAHAA